MQVEMSLQYVIVFMKWSTKPTACQNRAEDDMKGKIAPSPVEGR